MKRFLPLLGMAALVAACSGNNNAAGPAASATGAASASVAELDQQFIAAWNAKDAAKATSLLADDVQFLQGETHFSGKGDVTNKWITPTIGSIANLKTNVVSSGSSDALAYEAGTFSADVLPSPAQPRAGEGQGNYLFLWKKAADGTWKLALAQLEDLPVQVK